MGHPPDRRRPRRHRGADVGAQRARDVLRFWAPLVALGAGATLSIAGFAVAGVLLALSAWSWTWMRKRTGRERRRAQLNQLAFETACDPLIRHEGQCITLRPAIDARFAEVNKAISELRAFTDELCDCPTPQCVRDLVDIRVEDLERLEKVAVEGVWTEDTVKELGERARHCVDEKMSLPE